MSFFKISNRSKFRTKAQVAEFIEYFVNNSDLTLESVASKFSISTNSASNYLSKYYFGINKINGIEITMQSKINDSLNYDNNRITRKSKNWLH